MRGSKKIWPYMYISAATSLRQGYSEQNLPALINWYTIPLYPDILYMNICKGGYAGGFGLKVELS